MKNVKAMTTKELVEFILNHKEDTIEFAMTNGLYPDSPQSIDDCCDWWFSKIINHPEYSSYNIFMDFCGGGYGTNIPYNEPLNSNMKEDVMNRMQEFLATQGADTNDEEEFIVYVDISPYVKTECVETCPHCGEEVEINWCTKENGYEVYCPYCGKKIMLCDECMHANDNVTQKCDWCKETGCFRNKK